MRRSLFERKQTVREIPARDEIVEVRKKKKELSEYLRRKKKSQCLGRKKGGEKRDKRNLQNKGGGDTKPGW